MKMARYRKDGFNVMYTKILRRIVKWQVRFAGHCDGSGGHVGHCF